MYDGAGHAAPMHATSADNPLLSDNPRAWQELIDSAGPASLLVAIESRLGAGLRTRLSPDDILQEALLHAWRDRANCQWRGPRSFRSWLLSIIDNRIHDAADFENAAKRGGRLRHQAIDAQRERSGDGPNVVPPALIASTTPSRVAMFREQAAAIRAAIESLPGELREVVRLRLIEHRTIEQTAEQLSIGVAAARHRFRKGAELYRQRLHAALASRSHSIASDFAPVSSADSSA